MLGQACLMQCTCDVAAMDVDGVFRVTIDPVCGTRLFSKDVIWLM